MKSHVHPPPHAGGSPLNSMKTVLCLLLACLAVLSTMNVKAQSGKHAITAATLDWKISRSGELKYLLYVPPDYQASGTKPWPLMLFLHGAGERGSDVQKVAVHGPLKLVRHGTNFPFIIVAPQCAENRLWENGPLLQLLDQVERNYRVDRKRVYLTGLSMGGYGTWSLGLQHPERFAALVPICGGGNMIDVLLGPRDHPDDFKHLAIWAFHGEKDSIVPVSESRRLVEQLRKIGVKNVKLTLYPEANHDSWTETYDNPKLYEWLREQVHR